MQSPAIIRVWISADHWEHGNQTPDDEIVDVKVTLSDGSAWLAKVCSYRHVGTLRSRWSKAGECLGGRYLWASNLILALDTSRDTIEAMLKDLLANGEFRQALARG